MKKFYLGLLFFAFSIVSLNNVKAQSTGVDFNQLDCNGNPAHLFADLDAGKAVVLFYYMPSCGSCPPWAQKIQTMANNINNLYPGTMKGYAFPFQNVTTCSYSSSWTSSNSLPFFAPMDSGAADVAYYGGFGMPTAVLLGGSDHRVMYFTMSLATGDTTKMRDSVYAMLGVNPLGVNSAISKSQEISIYPNPANDFVELSGDFSDINAVEIFDITGKKVLGIPFSKTSPLAVERKIDVSGIPSGLYFFKFHENGKSITRKVSIHH